ncbi:MAG TPA: Hsp20/alpha crystallin family protein [Candidatus Saccharimonadales bacterium]|nr:Hsp20/alpha crystallin family protein [Candidatus Saccharimonadales bacterium]
MALIRWNDPFAGLTSMHSQLDDMFNNFFGSGQLSGGNAPAMDVYTENDKELVAEVHAPGFTKDDIEVNVQNGALEIKGEKHEKTEDKDKKRNYMVHESHASFYRSIALPKAAGDGDVKADFTDGVLKVRVPLKELPAPKKIAIGEGKK